MRNVLAEVTSAQFALKVCAKLRRVIARQGRMIVISAMPKSGSTFLYRTLATVTGYQRSFLGYAYGNSEQELYLPKLIDAYGTGTVIHQHFRANRANLALLRQFRVRPVVLQRNVFDLLVSVRDHLVQEQRNHMPGLHAPPEFRNFGGDQQLDFVVDMIAPWYISYYVSWQEAATQGFPFLALSYEDASKCWANAVVGILSYYDIHCSADAIDKAIHASCMLPREQIRLNQGIVGRGREVLSTRQQERIMRLVGHYPSIDFSPIGL